ncbi:hypothetical protein PQX77_014207 [Marasmius sp. AFHP31]|nr:hypothetical protein PQX77_014207 [Marasmius sp. AFHP31]
MDSDHPYIPSEFPKESRSPCPALNALANHGYMYVDSVSLREVREVMRYISSPRSGKDIDLKTILTAITSVYNFSYPLALLLAIPALLIYGKLNFNSSIFFWNWNITFDLASLSKFGAFKIAHKASHAHPDFPSHSPDPALVRDVVSRAHKDISGSEPGLTLHDIATIRVEREARLDKPLDTLHVQIAQGESALLYHVLRNHYGSTGMVPASRLAQWLGEERLPDNWWQEVRPPQTLGLVEVRRTADEVGEIMAAVRTSGPRA